MTSFSEFINQKEIEMKTLLNRRITYENAQLFGLKSMSTRQPLFTHAVISQLEMSIPLTTKTEVIFEAIRSSAEEYVKTLDEKSASIFWAKVHIRTSLLLPVLSEPDSSETGLFRSPEPSSFENFIIQFTHEDPERFTDDDLKNLYDFYLTGHKESK